MLSIGALPGLDQLAAQFPGLRPGQDVALTVPDLAGLGRRNAYLGVMIPDQASAELHRPLTG